MSHNWGPRNIVPSPALGTLSGKVKLREELDDVLLAKDLEELGYSGPIEKISNPWYFRKKGNDTWIKIGESDDRKENFPVLWDTSDLDSGEYEVLGLMHVTVRKGDKQLQIARENVEEVVIAN